MLPIVDIYPFLNQVPRLGFTHSSVKLFVVDPTSNVGEEISDLVAGTLNRDIHGFARLGACR